MNKYEVLYILSSTLDEASREAEIEKLSQAVVEAGGEVENVNKWGMKKLAYPINFKNEGYYVLMTFNAPSSFPLELERRMRITDGIVRFIVARLA